MKQLASSSEIIFHPRGRPPTERSAPLVITLIIAIGGGVAVINDDEFLVRVMQKRAGEKIQWDFRKMITASITRRAVMDG